MNTIAIDNNTPLWQLTIGQLTDVLSEKLQLHHQIAKDYTPTSGKTYEYGIPGIMRTFQIKSSATANNYKKILDPIISQPGGKGGKFTFCVEEAIELMKNHKEKEVVNE